MLLANNARSLGTLYMLDILNNLRREEQLPELIAFESPSVHPSGPAAVALHYNRSSSDPRSSLMRYGRCMSMC